MYIVGEIRTELRTQKSLRLAISCQPLQTKAYSQWRYAVRKGKKLVKYRLHEQDFGISRLKGDHRRSV